MPKEIFPNTGFIKSKLNKEVMNRLNLYIKNKKDSHKPSLAGNISNSYKIDDKDSPIKAANTQKVVCAFEALILLIPKLM